MRSNIGWNLFKQKKKRKTRKHIIVGTTNKSDGVLWHVTGD